MPRWPVDVPRATPNGKYGAVRTKDSGASCGTKPFPCVHNGLDLAGPAGTEVYAPEDLSVDSVSTGFLPPFTGYDPGVMLARGTKSGVYHLFGHLDPDTIQSPTQPGTWWDYATTPLWKSTDQRNQIKEGEIIGRMSRRNHVHWEVRQPGWNGARTNPALWIKRYVSPGLDVKSFSDGGDGEGLLVLLLLGYLVMR